MEHRRIVNHLRLFLGMGVWPSGVLGLGVVGFLEVVGGFGGDWMGVKH